MRRKAFFQGIVVACAATAAIAGYDIVYGDASALAHLQATNPNHYVQVRCILATANYLCRPRARTPTLP